MTKTELFYFTGKCLGLDNHPEFAAEIVRKNKNEEIDWSAFVEMCSNHLVLPTIYLRFERHGIISHLPTELTDHLKMIYDLNLERNSRILYQMTEITKLLNGDGIFPIFLKGGGNIIDGLYSSIGERILGDIDFLVPEADYLRSAKLLESVGYTASFKGIFDDVETLKDYPSLVHPDFATHIEVHRMLVMEKYKNCINYKLISDDLKKTSELPGCYVLSDKHNVVLNFVHGQLHHSGHANGIVSFRDLYDLSLLSGRIDPTTVLSEMKHKNKARAYFKFVSECIGLKGNQKISKNLSYRCFKLKHKLNLTSSCFYKTNRLLVFFSERLDRYFAHFRRFIFSSRSRKALLGRLKNPEWYRSHINMYLKFFGGAR